jgi:hypothetical protein
VTALATLPGIPAKFLTPAERAANRSFFTRVQYESTAVQVEAFAVAVVIGADEPAPYYLSPAGEAVVLRD